MKIRKALLLAALLVLGAFFVHIASMRPSAEDLSRAAALETMLAEEFLPAPERENRALAAPRSAAPQPLPEKTAKPARAVCGSPLFGAKKFDFAQEARA